MTSVTKSMDDVKGSMQVLGKSIGDVGAAAVKINEITGTIRGIADETNLLALNASIEAARAGEAEPPSGRTARAVLALGHQPTKRAIVSSMARASSLEMCAFSI